MNWGALATPDHGDHAHATNAEERDERRRLWDGVGDDFRQPDMPVLDVRLVEIELQRSITPRQANPTVRESDLVRRRGISRDTWVEIHRPSRVKCVPSVEYDTV